MQAFPKKYGRYIPRVSECVSLSAACEIHTVLSRAEDAPLKGNISSLQNETIPPPKKFPPSNELKECNI